MALAAALSVQSPFTNDAFRNSDCVAARKNLDSDHGDPITLLNAYREWLQVHATSYSNLASNAFSHSCSTRSRRKTANLVGNGVGSGAWRSNDFTK